MRVFLSRVVWSYAWNSGMQMVWVLTCTGVNFSVVQLSMSCRCSCQVPKETHCFTREWNRTSGWSSMLYLGWIDICSYLPSKSEKVISLYLLPWSTCQFSGNSKLYRIEVLYNTFWDLVIQVSQFSWLLQRWSVYILNILESSC